MEGALRELSAIQCSDDQCRARTASLRGTAFLFSGQYGEAESAFTEALGLFRKTGERKHIVDVENNLGTVHFYRGEYAEALVRYQAAEAELKGLDNREAEHLTAANKATLYQRLGRYRQALDVYLKLGRSPQGLSVSERAQLLSNLAVLNRRLGDPYKTRVLLNEALGLMRREMHRDTWLGIVKNLGIVLALDFGDLKEAERLFREAVFEASEAGDLREAMQARLYLAETLFRQKKNEPALELWQRTLADSRQLKTAEDEWRSLYGIARVLRQKQTMRECMNKIEAVRGGIGVRTLKSEFLSDKQDVYEDMLGLVGGDTAEAFSVMERARALLLREALPDQATRLTLAQFQQRLRAGEAALLYRVGRANSFLLVVTPERSELRRLPVSESTLIEWLDAVRADVDGAAAAKQSLASLLLPEMGNAQRLWIVPDGVLSFLPFEVLPIEGKLLVERFETAYLPAAGLLRSGPVRQFPLRWPWQKQLIAYAEPDVSGAQLLPGDERWPALPDSGKEVSAISQMLPGRASIYRGSAVTTAELLDGNAPILHLATHGAGDPESSERNRILVGRSYLTEAQLTPNRLRNLDLVVLSACETESGPLSRGEGVQSLARGFLAAGAKATVASLWKVDDAATRLLMEEFYRRLAGGEAIGKALQGAKLSFLRSHRALHQPRYWAAFVAQGAAAEPVPLSVSWTAVSSAAAVILLLVAFVSKRRLSG